MDKEKIKATHVGMDENGNILHVDELGKERNGKKCGLICPSCERRLNSYLLGNKQRKHFRHHGEHCGISKETELHLMAKRILVESKSVLITRRERFNYEEAQEEVIAEQIKPDVILKDTNATEWFIEIKVHHAIDAEKNEKIRKQNVNCLEIDLSKLKGDIHFDQIKREVLDNSENRHVIFRKKKEKEFDFLPTLFFLALAYILGRAFNLQLIGQRR